MSSKAGFKGTTDEFLLVSVCEPALSYPLLDTFWAPWEWVGYTLQALISVSKFLSMRFGNNTQKWCTQNYFSVSFNWDLLSRVFFPAASIRKLSKRTMVDCRVFFPESYIQSLLKAFFTMFYIQSVISTVQSLICFERGGAIPKICEQIPKLTGSLGWKLFIGAQKGLNTRKEQ